MDISAIVARGLVVADRFCDYIPILSSLSNAIVLVFQKYVCPNLSQETRETHHYWKHITDKNEFRCKLLLIPVLGNLCAIIVDLSVAFRVVATDPTAQTLILEECSIDLEPDTAQAQVNLKSQPHMEIRVFSNPRIYQIYLPGIGFILDRTSTYLEEADRRLTGRQKIAPSVFQIFSEGQERIRMQCRVWRTHPTCMELQINQKQRYWIDLSNYVAWDFSTKAHLDQHFEAALQRLPRLDLVVYEPLEQVTFGIDLENSVIVSWEKQSAQIPHTSAEKRPISRHLRFEFDPAYQSGRCGSLFQCFALGGNPPPMTHNLTLDLPASRNAPLTATINNNTALLLSSAPYINEIRRSICQITSIIPVLQEIVMGYVDDVTPLLESFKNHMQQGTLKEWFQQRTPQPKG